MVFLSGYALAFLVASASAAPAGTVTDAQTPSSTSWLANLLGGLNLISNITIYVDLNTAPITYEAPSNFHISNSLPNIGIFEEDIYFVSIDVNATYGGETYAVIQQTFNPPLRVPSGQTVQSPNVTTMFVPGPNGQDPFTHVVELIQNENNGTGPPFHLDLVTADQVTFLTTIFFGSISLPISVPLLYNQKNITFNPILYVG